MIEMLYAQSAGPAKGAPGGFLLPILLVFLVMYFLVLRPQSRKQKQLEKQREALKKGDKVVTAGGIYGKVTKVKDNIISLEIANNVIIDLAKSSIGTIVNNENAASKTDKK